MSNSAQTVSTVEFLKWVASEYENEDFRKNVNPTLPDLPDSCTYYEPDTGRHCLIGEWLSRVVGIEDYVLSEFDHADSIPTASKVLDYLADQDVITFENPSERERMKKTLNAFQSYADELVEDEWRRTWGEAIDLGMNHVNYPNWEKKRSI